MMSNRNLVGRMTGTSAGFSPLESGQSADGGSHRFIPSQTELRWPSSKELH
jgi:hypothetical protein